MVVLPAHWEPDPESNVKKCFPNNGIQEPAMDKLYIGKICKPGKTGKVAGIP